MATSIEDLCDELLLLCFEALSNNSSQEDDDDERPEEDHAMPFRNEVHAYMSPHQGLRGYPFLGQVCKRWNGVLNTRDARKKLWNAIVLDFGQELVTSIHTPLQWSNQRPSPDEYEEAFQRTFISTSKIINWVLEPSRKGSIRSLTISNTVGFWSDDDDYVDLDGKSDFQASSFGFIAGSLSSQLTSLQLFNCSNLFASDPGCWVVIQQCKGLRSLAIEAVSCRISGKQASNLSSLVSLESLTLIGEERHNQSHWICGLEEIPQAWTRLVRLHKMELRGHTILACIPAFLVEMKNLKHLDISSCANLNISQVTRLVQLETLVLQRLHLSQPVTGNDPVSVHSKRILPDLSGLTALKVLSLSHNSFTRLPLLTSSLEVGDFKGNKELQILSPINSLIQRLPNISLLDFGGIHLEKSSNNCWSDEKCKTMKNLAEASRALKRRKIKAKILMDKS